MDFCPDVKEGLEIFGETLPNIERRSLRYEPLWKFGPEEREPCDDLAQGLVIFGSRKAET